MEPKQFYLFRMDIRPFTGELEYHLIDRESFTHSRLFLVGKRENERC